MTISGKEKMVSKKLSKIRNEGKHYRLHFDIEEKIFNNLISSTMWISGLMYFAE